MTMRFVVTLLLCLLVAAPAAHAAEEAALAAGMVNPGYEEQPEWFKHSFLDLREDLKEAGAASRRVMLYFYQDGCPYCKKMLQDNFGQRPIAEKTRQNFDVIAINIMGDTEVTSLRGKKMSEKAFSRQMRIMFTPTLVVLDEHGEAALRMNGYYEPIRFSAALDYAGQRKKQRASFEEYFESLSPAPAHGKLHEDARYLAPPFQLDQAIKASGKPLLVMLEQKECQACDELHLDILRRRESADLLEHFQVALLDIWSKTALVTPDGHKTTAQEWAKKLHVQYAPTMIFFDASGTEVFRAEAYLKAFHVQTVLDYVASGAYRQYPEFQRFVEARADSMRKRGIVIDLMK